MGHIVDFLDRSLRLCESEKLLNDIPRIFDLFPSLKQIEECFRNYIKGPIVSRHVDPKWESKQAPGTPAAIEALFQMIDRGSTQNAAFNHGLRYVGATENELWTWFESWKMRDIHPKLKLRTENLIYKIKELK